MFNNHHPIISMRLKLLFIFLQYFLLGDIFAQDTVAINTAIQFQTIKGWGGEGGQNTQYEGSPPYLINQIINTSVNDLGLTGLRYESFQGNETFSYGPHHTWEFTNDNGSPDTLISSTLDTGAIDYYMQNLFVPWKNAVVAKGDSFNFYFSPSWYSGGSTGDIPAFLRYSPGEYAEYYIANLQYLKRRYGLTADYATMCNEAGNGNQFTPQVVGTMIKTVAPRMLAAGLSTTIQFPECVSAQTSWQYIQAEAGDTAIWPYIKCLSYHLYGTNDPYRALIDSFAKTRGLLTAQREYIGLGVQLLYQDLTWGGVSYWDYYGNSDYMPLNTNNTWFTFGAKYWTDGQVIRHVRPGAVRVSAVTNDTTLQPLAFTHNGQTTAVILNMNTSSTTHPVTITGLVPGSYCIGQSTGSGTPAELGVFTVAASGNLTLTITAQTVISIYPHPANFPPLATKWAANPTFLDLPTSSVVLSSSALDPELGTLTYHWTVDSFPAGANVVLSNANISGPTATGMTIAGNYVFGIHISDGTDTTVKQVTVQVFSGNQAPIISTLQSRIPVIVTLPVDTTILQGFCYDLEADALTYAWSVVSQPAGAAVVLATPTAANRCTARNMTVAGNYVFKYAVSDPTHTVSRNLTVPVFPLNDTPVIASVSANPRNTNTTADSSLLSAVTSDPNGDIITHWWTVSTAPAGANPVFSAQGERVTEVSNLTIPGIYVFTLTLIDRTLYTTKKDTVIVSACTIPVTPLVTGASSFCQGQSTALTISNTCTGCTYLWSNGHSGDTINISAAGTYNVTATNACSSVSSTNFVTTQNPLPVTPVINGNTSFCPGQSTTLSVLDSCSGCNYNWSNGQHGSAILITDSGFYYAVATNTCGSDTSSATRITVSATTPAPLISGTDSFCTGHATTLQVANTCTGCIYQWSNGNTGPSVSVDSAGVYSVSVSSSCGSATADVSVAGIVPVSVSITASANILTAQATGAAGYQWYLNGNAITGATSATYAATGTGNYSVDITGLNGCISSASYSYVTGIVEFTNEDNILIYPNPGNGQIIVALTGNNYISIKLFNALGQEVYARSITPFEQGQNIQLNLNQLAGGIYTLRVIAQSGMVSKQVVLEK